MPRSGETRADELQLAGRHNHLNVLAALALGSALNMPLEGLIEEQSSTAVCPIAAS